MIIHRAQSFTLVEVLVASVVVSIILLGVVTTSISLNNTARYSATSYFVTQNTQTTLNHILNSVSMAVGNTVNPGIVIGSPTAPGTLIGHDSSGADIYDPGSGDANTMCIHQNINPITSLYDPNSDRWLCYTYLDLTKEIYWCVKTYDVNNPPNSAGYVAPGVCSAADIVYRFLGKSKEVPQSRFEIESSADPKKILFTTTIKNCLDQRAGVTFGACAAGNANNPYVEKTGSVSPAGHSS